MISVPLAFLILFGAGCLYLRPVAAGTPPLLTAALAHLIGSAAIGFGVTVGLVVTDRPQLLWAGLGLAGVALAGLLARRRDPMQDGEAESFPAYLTSQRFGRVLAGLVSLGVLTAVARVILLPLDWDGWAIWQLKAKAMAHGGLRELLTSPRYEYSHPDYPLLLPANTWWLSAGRFEEKVAQANGLLFFLDLLILLYYGARLWLPKNAALLGCAVLVSWPAAQKHAASGFADVPLAAFVLATALFLARRRFWLAMPCLVGALLTKNEGLFTLAAVVSMALGEAWVTRRSAGGWIRLGGVLGAALAGAGTWMILKQRWHLTGDLLDPSKWPPDLTDILLDRVGVVAAGFAREGLAVGPRYPGWGFFWPAALLAAALALKHRRTATTPFWILTAVHLAAAFAAYLVTPADPVQHMSTSLDRLYLQIAPVALLTTLVVLWPSGTGRDARAT